MPAGDGSFLNLSREAEFCMGRVVPVGGWAPRVFARGQIIESHIFPRHLFYGVPGSQSQVQAIRLHPSISPWALGQRTGDLEILHTVAEPWGLEG